jgi:hypothetical protein
MASFDLAEHAGPEADAEQFAGAGLKGCRLGRQFEAVILIYWAD